MLVREPSSLTRMQRGDPFKFRDNCRKYPDRKQVLSFPNDLGVCDVGHTSHLTSVG